MLAGVWRGSRRRDLSFDPFSRLRDDLAYPIDDWLHVEPTYGPEPPPGRWSSSLSGPTYISVQFGFQERRMRRLGLCQRSINRGKDRVGFHGDNP